MANQSTEIQNVRNAELVIPSVMEKLTDESVVKAGDIFADSRGEKIIRLVGQTGKPESYPKKQTKIRK